MISEEVTTSEKELIAIIRSNPDSLKVLELTRSNPKLLHCFIELSEIASDNIEGLQLLDDAEVATIEIGNKTMQAVLEKWAQHKAKKAEAEYAEDKEYRPHEKKSHRDNLDRAN
jgi:hypothetical protein